MHPLDDPFAARLRGFGPIGLLAVLLILAGNAILAPLSAVLVLVVGAAVEHPVGRDRFRAAEELGD